MALSAPTDWCVRQIGPSALCQHDTEQANISFHVWNIYSILQGFVLGLSFGTNLFLCTFLRLDGWVSYLLKAGYNHTVPPREEGNQRETRGKLPFLARSLPLLPPYVLVHFAELMFWGMRVDRSRQEGCSASLLASRVCKTQPGLIRTMALKCVGVT